MTEGIIVGITLGNMNDSLRSYFTWPTPHKNAVMGLIRHPTDEYTPAITAK